MRMRRFGCAILVVSCLFAAQAQESVLTGHVDLVAPGGKAWRGVQANTAVWLIPLTASAPTASAGDPKPTPRLVQKNKSFQPRVVILRAGTAVEFPNRDPFFHNVFSLFDGKRFDLGLYEAGGTRFVHFDKPGISYIFCNIHPEMSAAVIAVDTPYFGLSNRSGRVTIADVPDGRYQLNVWYERSLPENLKSVSRAVTISESARTLEPIKVIENTNFSLEHKNKYGQEYVPPANTSPVYGRP